MHCLICNNSFEPPLQWMLKESLHFTSCSLADANERFANMPIFCLQRFLCVFGANCETLPMQSLQYSFNALLICKCRLCSSTISCRRRRLLQSFKGIFQIIGCIPFHPEID